MLTPKGYSHTVLRWWTSDMWRVLRDHCDWSRTKRNKAQSPPTKWQQRVWKHHHDTRLTASPLIFPIPTEQEAIGINHQVNNSKGSWLTSSSLCNMYEPQRTWLPGYQRVHLHLFLNFCQTGPVKCLVEEPETYPRRCLSTCKWIFVDDTVTSR